MVTNGHQRVIVTFTSANARGCHTIFHRFVPGTWYVIHGELCLPLGERERERERGGGHTLMALLHRSLVDKGTIYKREVHLQILETSL